ncbi:MAG: phosphoribosylaminoimidazolesuccinocarboxamide synthase [Acidobacteria bacterium]|nr:phosphoribosylaminoimidazolesuccinocarboxamide synthase [Acidobacteriota bacterium]
MTSYSAIDLKELALYHRGKVRDIFQFQDKLLIVASDRISAFDCVLPTLIPHKGEVLTQLTEFWLQRTAGIVPNHRIATRFDDFPSELRPFRSRLLGRSMLVVKARPFPVECVVRGYLAGSGWKDYQLTGAVCGIRLPKGLRQCDRLPEPIFTPSTKAQTGHDENISFQAMTERLGTAVSTQLRDLSLRIYREATEYAMQRGIIISDTKFEFGLHGDRLLLIDEVLTPDSSRFWPADRYQPGGPQPSFDKQFVRDYLESISWDKNPPAPELPASIVEVTSQKYLQAYSLLTGKALTVA